MFLKHKQYGDLVEVLTPRDLCDPCRDQIEGQSHAGQERQDPACFSKQDLIFPSGESLPRCWLDPDYRTAPMTTRAVLVR